MDSPPHILGIDIGSVSIAIAEMTTEKKVVKTAYAFHFGNITECLKKLLDQFDLPAIGWVASTASTPSLLKTNQWYDNRIAAIAAAHQAPVMPTERSAACGRRTPGASKHPATEILACSVGVTRA